jgi:hypothetical protein
MTRKIITGVIAAVLLATIAVFAAEKVKEKVLAEKPKAGEQGEKMGQPERLLDQLAEAYKANDRQKMGEIISKMQERREKMREFVKLNRWHQWAHHRMMWQARFGWGPGQQMAGPGMHRGMAMGGPGWNRGWAMQGQGWNQGPQTACPQCGQFQAMGGQGFAGRESMMEKYRAMANEFRQMQWQQHGMGNWMPPQDGPMQMRGWDPRFQQGWAPQQGEENMEPQRWNMPRRERQNIPPPEWGW